MSLFKNILSAIILTGVFALHPSLNKGDTPITYLQYFFYGNSLNISTNNSIDKNLLEIKWLCETQNIAYKNLVIFRDGRQVNDIPFEKGEQKLIVYYNQNKIAEIPQYKTTDKQAHQYKIDLSAKDNILFFKGEITGPASYHGAPVTIASL